MVDGGWWMMERRRGSDTRLNLFGKKVRKRLLSAARAQ